MEFISPGCIKEGKQAVSAPSVVTGRRTAPPLRDFAQTSCTSYKITLEDEDKIETKAQIFTFFSLLNTQCCVSQNKKRKLSYD